MNIQNAQSVVIGIVNTQYSPIVRSVRQSRSNNSAILFAFATDTNCREQALQDRAHFVLRRPIESTSVRQTLSAAYDLMRRERRRYFRVAANLSAQLRVLTSKTAIQCTTINISSNGIAVANAVPFNLAEMVEIRLSLPDGFVVCGDGIVIWDDKHGKCGFRFHCRTHDMRNKLDSWLDSQFVTGPDS
jgi:hypothetical protein